MNKCVCVFSLESQQLLIRSYTHSGTTGKEFSMGMSKICPIIAEKQNRPTLTECRKSWQYLGCCRQGSTSAVIKNEAREPVLMCFAYASSNCSDLGDGSCLRCCCIYANQCDWRQASGLTGSKNKDHQIEPQTLHTKPSSTVVRWLVLSPHSKVPRSNPLADWGLSERSLHVLPVPVWASFAYFSFLFRNVTENACLFLW